MSRQGGIQVLFLATISLFWVERLYHYYLVLQDYAQRGMHLTHTDLYVAVESWLLLCAVMFTATATLLVAATAKETDKVDKEKHRVYASGDKDLRHGV